MRHHVRIGRTMARAAAVPLVALATVLGTAGSAQAEPPALGKKEIVYALPGGGSALVMVSVASRMLEAVGYEVDHRTITTGLVYPALANGDVDVFSSAFLPGQQSHVNKYEDKLDFLGTSYAPVPSGLMAPAYVPFNTIEDLADPAVRDSLEGEIHSGGAGWGVSIRASETRQIRSDSRSPIGAAQAGITGFVGAVLDPGRRIDGHGALRWRSPRT